MKIREHVELNTTYFTSEMELYTIVGLLDEHMAIKAGTPSSITYLAKTPEQTFEIGENFIDNQNGEGYIIYDPNGFEIFNLTDGDSLNYIEPAYKNIALSKIDWLKNIIK